MIEEMKNDKDIKLMANYYRDTVAEMMLKMFGGLGIEEDMNKSVFEELLNITVDKYYQALDLTFDNIDEVRTYALHCLKYREENALMKGLTEKSSQDTFSDENILKLFTL